MTNNSKFISALGVIGTMIGIWTFINVPLVTFYHHLKEVNSSMDSVRYVRGKQEENHDFLLMQYQNISKIEDDIDSLKKWINFVQRGKYPYDSIALKDRTGAWFKATIQDEFKLSNQ